MSTTQHEVGQVPSAIPARPPFGGSALILSIIGIVVLSLIGSPAGLAVGIVLLFINGRRYRLVGIIGTALSATIMVTTIAYFAIIFGTVAHTVAAPVATTAPVATASATQEPAPPVVVPAPSALPTNPVETGPIQPVAATPEGTVRAIEAYRVQAYETGDPAPLVNYYAPGINARNDSDYRTEITRVNTVKTGNLIGHMKVTVTKITMNSVTSTRMSANVAIKESADTTTQVNLRYWNQIYQVVGGRWLVTISYSIAPF